MSSLAPTLLTAGAVVMSLSSFIGLVVFLQLRSAHSDKYRARVQGLQRAAGIDVVETGVKPGRLELLGSVRDFGEFVRQSGLLSKKTLDEFQHTLAIAGFRNRGALGMLIGGKMMLLVGLPAVTWLVLSWMNQRGALQICLTGVAAMAGLMVPDMIIKRMRKKHLAALESGLADALDLLVICSEAGLGLEPALERVGQEIRAVHSAVAEEMMQTSHEMRVNADRRAALINMGKRTGVESLRRLGGTMVQSLQYGTPLSQALRVLSAEMRQEAMNRYEAKAGRLSVLLTMPMIGFILPCLFLIVGGPAIVQVFTIFRH